MKRRLPLALAAAALLLAGCGSASTTTPASSTSTPSSVSAPAGHSGVAGVAAFALHAGLAFGAFHRYIYKPLKAGDFHKLFTHKLALLKAAAAAVAIIHEIKLASADARANHTLARLAAPLTALGATIAAVLAGARSGHLDSSGIEAAKAAIGESPAAPPRSGRGSSNTLPRCRRAGGQRAVIAPAVASMPPRVTRAADG